MLHRIIRWWQRTFQNRDFMDGPEWDRKRNAYLVEHRRPW